MVGGTKTYGCGNKNLWLWEQKPMVVGTITYGCGNKYMAVGTKYMIVGTNLWLCE
jgi:hypothetical protein